MESRWKLFLHWIYTLANIECTPVLHMQNRTNCLCCPILCRFALSYMPLNSIRFPSKCDWNLIISEKTHFLTVTVPIDQKTSLNFWHNFTCSFSLAVLLYVVCCFSYCFYIRHISCNSSNGRFLESQEIRLGFPQQAALCIPLHVWNRILAAWKGFVFPSFSFLAPIFWSRRFRRCEFLKKVSKSALQGSLSCHTAWRTTLYAFHNAFHARHSAKKQAFAFG